MLPRIAGAARWFRRASATVAGVAETATQAEVDTGTDALRYLTPQTLKGRAAIGFCAHKNGTDQTGLSDITFVPITFGTEVYDVGGHFASDAWTPPAGKVLMTALVQVSGTFAVGGPIVVAIYKNAILFKNALAGASTDSVASNIIVVEDIANGTDVYTVFVYADVTSGNATVSGLASRTSFKGHWIGS